MWGAERFLGRGSEVSEVRRGGEKSDKFEFESEARECSISVRLWWWRGRGMGRIAGGRHGGGFEAAVRFLVGFGGG